MSADTIDVFCNCQRMISGHSRLCILYRLQICRRLTLPLALSPAMQTCVGFNVCTCSKICLYKLNCNQFITMNECVCGKGTGQLNKFHPPVDDPPTPPRNIREDASAISSFCDGLTDDLDPFIITRGIRAKAFTRLVINNLK